MVDSYVPLGEIMYFRVALSNATTSAPSDATGAVNWSIFEESTTAVVSTGTFTKNGTVTGLYWGSATLAAGSGFEVGKWYDLYVDATAGTAGHTVLHTFRVSSAESTVGAINAYAQAGTVVASTLTDIGAISTLASSTFDANIVNVKGTAAAGTQGTLIVVAASGSVSTITNPGTYDANLVSILGTGVVATSGTLTSVGTVGTALGTITASGTVTASTILDAGTPAVNLTQILSTAVVATAGTLTNIGTAATAGTVLGTVAANVVAMTNNVIDANAIANNAIGNSAIAANAIGSSELANDAINTIAAQVVSYMATGTVAAAGTVTTTVTASVPALTASVATLGALPAANAGPIPMLQWLYTVSYGTITQDATSQQVQNPGGTTIATAVVSGDTNTFTRGGFA